MRSEPGIQPIAGVAQPKIEPMMPSYVAQQGHRLCGIKRHSLLRDVKAFHAELAPLMSADVAAYREMASQDGP